MMRGGAATTCSPPGTVVWQRPFLDRATFPLRSHTTGVADTHNMIVPKPLIQIHAASAESE
jgi:hypothetical protein